MTTLGDRRGLAPMTGERPDPDALIKEARRLRRRRYSFIGAVLLILAGGTAGVLAASQGGGPRHSGGGHPPTAPAAPKITPPATATRLPGVVLPSSALFTQISVTAGGLLLTGETPATAERPASAEATCVAAPIDPLTLAVGKLTEGSCGDPLLFGRDVEAVNTPIPESNNATVSINRADPATGRVTDGPVVMTYGSYSDTRPVIAYGSRWIWIYDVETTRGPELLQVSAQSAAVVATIPMPAFYRPLLAADDGGVWVANSLGGSPATALSYVAAGSSAPSVVIADTNLPICSLEASGTSAWIAAPVSEGAGCTKQVVERFADHSPEPLFTATGPSLPLTVIGDEADGLWTMEYASASQEQIIHIDPDTGSESVVATVPAAPIPSSETDGGLVPGQAVYFGGSLYLLEPPYRQNGYLGYTSIVRVVPPPGT